MIVSCGDQKSIVGEDNKNQVPACTPGEEKCRCDGERCDEGLSCLSGLCVKENDQNSNSSTSTKTNNGCSSPYAKDFAGNCVVVSGGFEGLNEFKIRTASFRYSEVGSYNVSVWAFSDSTDLAACTAANEESYDILPPRPPIPSATLFLMRFNDQDPVTDYEYCKDGFYNLDNNCSNEPRSFHRCAVYSLWNEKGELVKMEGSISGSVHLTKVDPSTCIANVEAYFSGGRVFRATARVSGPDTPQCAHAD